MAFDQLLTTIWRAKLLFLGTLLACMAAVVALTLALPKTYQATAMLLVGVNTKSDGALALDTGVGEQLGRTYATLAAHPNVADAARSRLGLRAPRDEVLDRMTFTPVEKTQLLQIRAEGSSPEQAQSLANGYSAAFVERVSNQLDRGQTQARVSVNEPAARPSAAAAPQPPLYLGLGALISLFIAAGVALLKDRLDGRIRVAEHEHTLLGYPILARIPKLSNRSATRQAADQAFRLLKTNLVLAGEDPAQVIAVTSPNPREGKGTLSARLAVAAAQAGHSVVLIEADPRRPGLRKPWRGRETAPPIGLTSYLVGAAELEDVISPDAHWTGLDVMRSGPPSPGSSALLDSPRLATMFERLRPMYDQIIVDAPPVLVGADTSILARLADGVLYVIDGRRTTRSSAQAGLNQLQTTRARIIGVVLNRVRVPSVRGYPSAGSGGRLRSAREPDVPSPTA